MKTCDHNHRCRYTHGFYCEDCRKFFPLSSPTYRKSEYASTLGTTLHNIGAGMLRKGIEKPDDIKAMQIRLREDDDYEKAVSDAEILIESYGAKPNDSVVIIG